jgi:hypothetical protein
MWLYIALLLLIAQCAHADYDQLFGEWNTVFINGKFSKNSPWLYYLEGSERNSQSNPNKNGGQSFSMAQLTTYDGIGYQVNNHKFYIGYARQYSQKPYGNYVNENIAWQQYNYSDTTHYGIFSLRTRVEERTLAENSQTSLRYRQQVKVVYPFTDKISVVGSEELLISLNSVDWGPQAGFNQNRIFVGMGYNINKTYRTEVGYMNQYIDRGIVNDLMNNLISLNLYINVQD